MVLRKQICQQCKELNSILLSLKVCLKIARGKMFDGEMKLDDIELKSMSKLFEYEKLAREIDGCEDLDTLKHLVKLSIKLMFKQQETLTII